jgi:hypothetical protein
MSCFFDQFKRGTSRVLSRVAALSILAVTTLTGATLSYSVQSLGPNASGDAVFRYTYDLSGVTLQENQELQIRFSHFDLLLFQPNDPPGVPGDFSALALVDDPSLAPPFSVDVVYFGPGTPGSQEFLINQYVIENGSLLFQGTIESGFTIPAGGVTPIPEPATFALCGMGILAAGLVQARRRFGRRR